MPDSDKNKSTIDKLFDIADQALTPLEKVLSQPEAGTEKPPIEVWNQAFDEPLWGLTQRPGGTGAWHQFDRASLRAACGDEFESHEVTNREVLAHGRIIPACTSCIIAVTK